MNKTCPDDWDEKAHWVFPSEVLGLQLSQGALDYKNSQAMQIMKGIAANVLVRGSLHELMCEGSQLQLEEASRKDAEPCKSVYSRWCIYQGC